MTGMRLAACGLALMQAALGGVATPAQTPDDLIVSTEHRIVFDGRPHRYTARAGQLAIGDNKEMRRNVAQFLQNAQAVAPQACRSAAS